MGGGFEHAKLVIEGDGPSVIDALDTLIDNLYHELTSEELACIDKIEIEDQSGCWTDWFVAKVEL